MDFYLTTSASAFSCFKVSWNICILYDSAFLETVWCRTLNSKKTQYIKACDWLKTVLRECRKPREQIRFNTLGRALMSESWEIRSSFFLNENKRMRKDPGVMDNPHCFLI